MEAGSRDALQDEYSLDPFSRFLKFALVTEEALDTASEVHDDFDPAYDVALQFWRICIFGSGPQVLPYHVVG